MMSLTTDSSGTMVGEPTFVDVEDDPDLNDPDLNDPDLNDDDI
jgi:hypothetical protein